VSRALLPLLAAVMCGDAGGSSGPASAADGGGGGKSVTKHGSGGGGGGGGGPATDVAAVIPSRGSAPSVIPVVQLLLHHSRNTMEGVSSVQLAALEAVQDCGWRRGRVGLVAQVPARAAIGGRRGGGGEWRRTGALVAAVAGGWRRCRRVARCVAPVAAVAGAYGAHPRRRVIPLRR